MFISNLTPRQKTELAALTVEQALQRWQKLYAIGRKPSTVNYHNELLASIRRYWPDLQTIVSAVTDAQCVAFSESIKHLSTSRFNGLVNAMRNVIPEMACVPRRPLVIVPKAVPTMDELERLLAALDIANTGHAALVVRFLAFTGLRINEARLLKWEDVREDHIYARPETTKNGKPRCIPFIMGLEQVIAQLRRVRRYHVKRNGFLLPQANCKIALKYACRLAGVPHCTHHTFRHYFATRCILSGVDIPTVAKWLGHSDNGALLLRIYCHLLDDHSLAMAKRVKVLAHGQEVAYLPPVVSPKNVVVMPEGFFQGVNPPPGSAAQETVSADAAPEPVTAASLPALESEAV